MNQYSVVCAAIPGKQRKFRFLFLDQLDNHKKTGRCVFTREQRWFIRFWTGNDRNVRGNRKPFKRKTCNI